MNRERERERERDDSSKGHDNVRQRESKIYPNVLNVKDSPVKEEVY